MAQAQPQMAKRDAGPGHKVVTQEASESSKHGGIAGSQKPTQSTASSGALYLEGAFINVIVTPKISFSLPRRADWNVVDDISQEELRAAFLTRFPIQFDTDKLSFTCATPTRKLDEGVGCLVYRIGVEGAKEERVLLSILSEIDKAYSAKYERQLEEARSDLLSSSMNFQVVADEVRHAQQATAKRFEKDVGSLKGQLQTNQKRLFLLEQEKDHLQRSVACQESTVEQLRRDLTHASTENSEMKTKMGELQAQLDALRECLTASISNAQAPHQVTSERSDAAVQTNCQAEAVGRAEAEHWQRQFRLMSEWLQTGAELLSDGPLHQAQASVAGNLPDGTASAPAESRSRMQANKGSAGKSPVGIADATTADSGDHYQMKAVPKLSRARWSEVQSDNSE
eukprot:CAMPEP_0172762552 /NCGR_PEP_ID=MMETSP1074-20121228/173712_1 /TAXON_ID=2916 /ORGANISM="Ceratium fusus, Strain PA161109" /LENGTH=396 /DNA_ID=CAMNT_0013596971 /DNA_START=21 /DNA_END=1208 /DNA_ORIENTATION=-